MSDETGFTLETPPAPTSLDDVIADLQGFGLEEFGEILKISSGPRKLWIKIGNISVDDDVAAAVAEEDRKGYDFLQRVKANLLSRAVTWVNGVEIRTLTGPARLVTHPKTGERVDIRAALRDALMGFATEVMQVLWKVLMVHSQTIEDRLFASFPDAAVMTAVERRYIERIEKELMEVQRDLMEDGVADITTEATGEAPNGDGV